MKVESRPLIDGQEYMLVPRAEVERLERVEKDLLRLLQVETHSRADRVAIGADHTDWSRITLLKADADRLGLRRFVDEVRLVLPYGERIYTYQRTLTPDEVKDQLLNYRNYGWWQS